MFLMDFFKKEDWHSYFIVVGIIRSSDCGGHEAGVIFVKIIIISPPCSFPQITLLEEKIGKN
jgi:hypothetical protein